VEKREKKKAMERTEVGGVLKKENHHYSGTWMDLCSGQHPADEIKRCAWWKRVGFIDKRKEC